MSVPSRLLDLEDSARNHAAHLQQLEAALTAIRDRLNALEARPISAPYIPPAPHYPSPSYPGITWPNPGPSTPIIMWGGASEQPIGGATSEACTEPASP